jgi:hypothetical protein
VGTIATRRCRRRHRRSRRTCRRSRRRLKGYADARVTLPSDVDGAVTATLQKKKRREEQQRTGDAIVDPFAP